MKRLAASLAAAAMCAAAFALSGCALFFDKPIKEVNDSQLNWLCVRYHPASEKVKPIYINIVGVGSVEFKQGRSPLVFEPFSQNVDSPLWGDIYEEKLGVRPDQARWMMQLFVDAGLVTETKRMRRLVNSMTADASNGIASITAKLNGKLLKVRTTNPDIISVIESITEAIVSSRGFK